MIIWGTKAVTRKTDSGTFHCPNCGSPQFYERKTIQKHGHVYFIPLLPMGDTAEYVECQGCRETFRPEVLSFDPGQKEREFKSEFDRALKRLMVLMMMADGAVEEEEIATIMGIYESVAKRSLTRADVLREVKEAKSEGLRAADYAAHIGPYLNDHGKELVMRAVLTVAASDGHIDDAEKGAVGEIAHSLEMTPSHVKGILADLFKRS